MNEYPQLTKNQIKIIKSLHKKQGRDQYNLFIAEGLKICAELFNSDHQVNSVIIPGDAQSDVLKLVENLDSHKIFKVNRKIFNSLCDTKTPQDILAVVKIREQSILTDEPFIALEGLSDPGNLGTIIRTADWFGLKQIILNAECADVFNPKVVRASMGSIFRINKIRTNDLGKFISYNFPDHSIVSTFINEGLELADFQPPEKFGLILGSESKGISGKIKKITDLKINIGRIGLAESLNVSVAAGIILYSIAGNLIPTKNANNYKEK